MSRDEQDLAMRVSGGLLYSVGGVGGGYEFVDKVGLYHPVELNH